VPAQTLCERCEEILDEIGHVTSEVVISPPDDHEGNSVVDQVSKDKVRRFWDAMMKRFSNSETQYEESIIEGFKHGEDPEILIVVSKLLTGFDAPCNTVLYLCDKLKDHGLLQAIARVNRLCTLDGHRKDFGYVIDYEGLLGELDKALTEYSSLENFHEGDLADCVQDIRSAIRELPRLHGEVWDVFREVKNRLDGEAMEEHLSEQDRRDAFQAAMKAFGKALHLAMGSEKTYEIFPDQKIEKWRKDWVWLDKLRRSARRRFGDEADISHLAPKLRNLLDREVQSAPAKTIVDLVDVTDPAALDEFIRESEISDAAKADTIASATKRSITVRMDEDPALFKSFSKMLDETISAYRQRRLSEREYLSRVQDIAVKAGLKSVTKDVPVVIKDNPDAQAVFRDLVDFEAFLAHEKAQAQPGDRCVSCR